MDERMWPPHYTLQMSSKTLMIKNRKKWCVEALEYYVLWHDVTLTVTDLPKPRMQRHPVFEHSHHTTGTLHPADRWTPSCTSCNCRIFRNKLLGHDTDSWETLQKNILTLKQSCDFGWFPCGGYGIHYDNCTELNAKVFQPYWHFREIRHSCDHAAW
jgi:hypothetical protein